MRIKVICNHFILGTPDTLDPSKQIYFDPKRKLHFQYDRQEEFYFRYNNNVIKIEGSSWNKQVKDMEEALDTIKKFLHGSNYHIIDLVNMLS